MTGYGVRTRGTGFESFDGLGGSDYEGARDLDCVCRSVPLYACPQSCRSGLGFHCRDLGEEKFFDVLNTERFMVGLGNILLSVPAIVFAVWMISTTRPI